MIPGNIVQTDILKAIEWLNNNGTVHDALIEDNQLVFGNRTYPVSQLISVANTFANGEFLDLNLLQEHGEAAEKLLTQLGFQIKAQNVVES